MTPEFMLEQYRHQGKSLYGGRTVTTLRDCIEYELNRHWNPTSDHYRSNGLCACEERNGNTHVADKVLFVIEAEVRGDTPMDNPTDDR